MAAGKRPTADDARRAVQLLLSALADGRDLFDVGLDVGVLHPRHNTFPGEVFMRLAADALGEADATRDAPVSYEGLRERYLPEYEFRGRENRKIAYALLTPAALRGGLEPDLLDEVVWWGTDDFWQYAMYAAIAYIRVAAERQGVLLRSVCEHLAARHGVALASP